MIGLLALELLDTAHEFVLTALVVCTVMAATMVLLFRRIEEMRGRARLGVTALLALVAGVGVWTTHFVAMLGYRPDISFGYDIGTTLVSALVGVALVGGPLALSCFVTGWRRLALGGAAGAGVGAMHFTGMAALEGCSIAYSPLAVILAMGFGSGLFASARGTRHGLGQATQLILGVCTLHFVALMGITLESTLSAAAALDAPLLTAFIVFASLGLSLAAFAAIWSGRRVDAAREAAAEAEQRQNAAFATALRHMSNGLVMVDAEARISAINERARELLRLEPGDAQEGGRLRDFLETIGARNGWSKERVNRTIELHLQRMVGGGESRIEEEFEDGRILCVSCRSVPNGGAILTFDDFTEHRAAQAKIAHLAYYDALTGLPNRRSFREDMLRRLDGSCITMLLFDIDRFQTVNDTCGHVAGDALLARVSEALTSGLEGRGRVFRLGGDEFAILPDAPGEDAARALADALRGIIGDSFAVDGTAIDISFSVAIASSLVGDSPSQVLQRAELALQQAKAHGGGRIETYASGMLEEAQRRREIERDMARALEAGEFELHYQPLYRIGDRRLLGFEALIRWKHPVRGYVSPAEFIPLAEQNGFIGEIGAWVLEETCRQLAKWPDHIHVAVNLSAMQVRSPSIVNDVADVMARHGITADRLELELTETAMVEDRQQISETLRGLRRLGLRIAMDDFGTGYSSLAHLRDFELDRIKIDRSFVQTEADDIGARAVIRAVTSMARDLSILTIGEGIETPEQLARLAALGCDVGQGYLLGKPMPAKAAGEVIMVQSYTDDAADDVSHFRMTGS